jgi:hypothetical protein
MQKMERKMTLFGPSDEEASTSEYDSDSEEIANEHSD